MSDGVNSLGKAQPALYGMYRTDSSNNDALTAAQVAAGKPPLGYTRSVAGEEGGVDPSVDLRMSQAAEQSGLRSVEKVSDADVEMKPQKVKGDLIEYPETYDTEKYIPSAELETEYRDKLLVYILKVTDKSSNRELAIECFPHALFPSEISKLFREFNVDAKFKANSDELTWSIGEKKVGTYEDVYTDDKFKSCLRGKLTEQISRLAAVAEGQTGKVVLSNQNCPFFEEGKTSTSDRAIPLEQQFRYVKIGDNLININDHPLIKSALFKSPESKEEEDEEKEADAPEPQTVSSPSHSNDVSMTPQAGKKRKRKKPGNVELLPGSKRGATGDVP